MIESLLNRFRPLWDGIRRGREVRIGPLSLIYSHRLAVLKLQAARAIRDTAAVGLQAKAQAAEGAARATRSVVFLNNAYYNFFYLAQALRQRGWDAISVSLEDPKGPNALYYHGEDRNLFDDDPERMLAALVAFFEEVKTRFRMVHFYGIGQMSFFPTNYDYGDNFAVIPEDFLELKRLGIKIGYSQGGCNQGIAQSTFHRWSKGCCDRCVWQHNPRVCSDMRNLAWGHKLHQVIDLFATEGNPALDYQGTEKCYREPLTTALDPQIWRPDLDIPARYRLARKPGELIVYHAMGNFEKRAHTGRNAKGSGAVIAAVERLQSEGMNVRLEFVTGLPNIEVRFVQAQADVIVDQLNYGRYGATAREGMMLGKPTICRMDASEAPGIAPSRAISECPLVSADESTVYFKLRELLSDADMRRRIGEASRAYAMKWHSAEACAERFEKVYDRLIDPSKPAFRDVA